MKQRNKPKPAAVFGVDIGKNIFHVVGTRICGTIRWALEDKK